MINGKMMITDINYEANLEGMFPFLLLKIQSAQHPGTTFKFLNKMGEDSLAIVVKLLEYMSESEKEALLLWLFDTFREQIKDVLNQFLESREFGNAVQIGEIRLAKDEYDGLSLAVSRVRLDYSMLIKSSLVTQNIDSYADRLTEKFGIKGAGFFAKAALQVGAKAMPEQIEKKGVDILNRPDVNAKITEALTEGLRRQGLCLKIKGIVLLQDEKTKHPYDSAIIDEEDVEKKTMFQLPEKVEDSLIEALVRYLRDTKPADKKIPRSGRL
ncbi:MAG: hypothetical protein Q4E89_11695 [Eubacteriales bacterium]|nr:hypothetical protein [Eubacteriales bacterium]